MALRALTSDQVVVLVSSAIGAAGTVVSSWVLVLARRTRAAVNGNVDELHLRVELLEELLRWAREDSARDAPGPKSYVPTDDTR